MKEEFGLVILGWFLGLFTVLAVSIMVPSSKIAQYDAAIKSCEHSLPRDQNCVIVALPTSKD